MIRARAERATTVAAARVAMVAVALVAAAASGCDPGDAGFNPPPPDDDILCNEVATGATLEATATLDGSTLEVRIRHTGPTVAAVVDPEVTELVGATLVTVATPAPDLVVTLDVGSPPSASGRFTVTAVLQGMRRLCLVMRTFTFAITGGSATVS